MQNSHYNAVIICFIGIEFNPKNNQLDDTKQTGEMTRQKKDMNRKLPAFSKSQM